jgi:hypothetical protein
MAANANSLRLQTLPQSLQRALKRAKNGGGSVAIRDQAKIIGYFVPCDIDEIKSGPALRRFLSSRMKGPTISHEEVQAQVRRYVKRLRRKV